MTAILQTKSAKTCWPFCANICAGPWTSLFSCCPQTIRSVRILSREAAEDVLRSSDERNGRDNWIDLSAVADSSGCVCAIALLTTHANGLNQAANLQIGGWPLKSQHLITRRLASARYQRSHRCTPASGGTTATRSVIPSYPSKQVSQICASN